MDLRQALLSAAREIGQTALISLAIFFFVYVFLVQPHRVKGESMHPNFADGELLLTEKVDYYLHRPNRGDVVVFEAPNNRKVDFIKRIIGLPGETIKISEGVVFVDGEKIDENYVNSGTTGEAIFKLGEDELLVLGDNRNSSADSRSFGPIKRSSIRGKAWLVYWPILKSSRYRGLRLIPQVHYRISNSFNEY